MFSLHFNLAVMRPILNDKEELQSRDMDNRCLNIIEVCTDRK